MLFYKENAKEALAMTFEVFYERYIFDYSVLQEKGIPNYFMVAISILSGCQVLDAGKVPMRKLVKFKMQEWRNCEGFKETCMDQLSRGYHKAGLCYGMSEKEIRKAEGDIEDTSDADVANTFALLQEQMEKSGSTKMEFKMERPDGFTWILTVLPPNYKET